MSNAGRGQKLAILADIFDGLTPVRTSSLVFLLYTLSFILASWANAGRGQKLAVLADLFDGLIRHVDSSLNS